MTQWCALNISLAIMQKPAGVETGKYRRPDIADENICYVKQDVYKGTNSEGCRNVMDNKHNGLDVRY